LTASIAPVRQQAAGEQQTLHSPMEAGFSLTPEPLDHQKMMFTASKAKATTPAHKTGRRYQAHEP
jgi:hypothetical protein